VVADKQPQGMSPEDGMSDGSSESENRMQGNGETGAPADPVNSLLNSVIPDNVTPETVVFMRTLIESFNASALQLKETYADLQQKFHAVNIELEETNRELSRSLIEKERLSSYLTNILESLSSGVLVIDTDCRITLFNAGAEEIAGINATDAVGRHYRDVMGENIPDHLTPIASITTGKRQEHLEKTLKTRKGEIKPIGYSTAPLVNSDGQVIGAVEIFMDLSHTKHLEAEIAHMDKLAALGQLAATMAHKIRNPLGGITGFAGLLQMELGDNENGRRILNKIIDGTDKISRIISSLLAYTSPLVLSPRTVNIRNQLDNALAVLAVEFDDKFPAGVHVEIEEPGGPVLADIDVESFQDALVSVLRNAVEAVSPDSGSVTVAIAPSDVSLPEETPLEMVLGERMKKLSKLLAAQLPHIQVRVTDNGDGMSRDITGNLFVPFFTTKENGIGLGLASARKIIDTHRGEIWIETREGVGTSVVMILPRTSALKHATV